MKYLGLYLGLILCLVLFTVNAQSQVISTTLHNFSSKSWNQNGNGQPCQPCHTPHAAKTSLQALWNHTASPDNYITWSAEGIGETSKKCLDCHDGQIALAAFGSAGVNTSGQHMNGGSVGGTNLGTDLGNDHPVNVSFSTTTGNPPVLKANVFEKNGTRYVGGTSGDLRLTKVSDTDYRVDCTTCHTPHGKAGVGFLLRKNNPTSVMCQDCHNK